MPMTLCLLLVMRAPCGPQLREPAGCGVMSGHDRSNNK
jgi:hypothetical protein